jgi:hypothetical protein
MAKFKTILATSVVVALTLTPPLWAGETERNQARRIHDRLTGVIATNDVIDAMERTLDCTILPPTPGYPCDGTGKNAARYAIDTAVNPNAHYFYNVTLKNYATPWTNEEQTVFAALNDYTATIVGSIRDQIDFRRILYDDLLYVGTPVTLPPYSMNDNDHYEQLEALDPNPSAVNSGNLADPAILRKTEQSTETALNSGATAGVMTSRAAAMAFFSDGTNRAMFRFTLMNHLCTDLEPLKDISRTPDRVRRDVSRSPGGDSRIFQNGCVGCHAGMDGMAGAFAYYEWDYTTDKSDGHLVYRDSANPKFDPTTAVSLKHNINPKNFEYGYVTTDDSWINYWRNGPNAKLGNRPGDSGKGWGHAAEVLDDKGNSIGNGAKSLGMELANSRAFAQCQVDKAFKAICLRDPNVFAADRTQRDAFVDTFSGSGYNMLNVFTDVAAYCKG